LDITQAAVQPVRRKGNGALGARMDFIGSPTNLVTILLVHVSDFLKEIERLSLKMNVLSVHRNGGTGKWTRELTQSHFVR